MNRFLLPLGLFVVLAVFLAIGLNRDPREVPSPLVGKPAPEFNVPQVEDGKNFSPKDMLGKVWLLNVWASWCVSCRAEHPYLVAFSKKADVQYADADSDKQLLVEFSKMAGIPLIGLNYKEVRGDEEAAAAKLSPDEVLKLTRSRATRWLTQHGDPYVLSALDVDGRVGINYGVYGVPETYLIDKAGVIRYKQIGPITPVVFQKTILPLVKELEK